MDFLLTADFWEKTPWIQQVAGLLTIVAIPYILLRYVTYRAKHKISFIPEETYHEVKLIDHYNQPQSIWLQLMVKNRGLELSKNAEAYLAEIWENGDGEYKQIKEFRSPVKLKWSHESDIFPIDILPKNSRRLDVCYVCEGEHILYLMTKGFPSGSIKNELPPGKYVFVIKVVGENSLFPATFLFNVGWTGRWRELTGEKYVQGFRLCGKPAKSFRLY